MLPWCVAVLAGRPPADLADSAKVEGARIKARINPGVILAPTDRQGEPTGKPHRLTRVVD
jgi:hypothetical protein